MDLHRRTHWFDLARHEDPPAPVTPPAPTPPAAAPAVPTPPPTPPAPPADDETSLPDKVKEVLRKEREARKEAEAKAKAGEVATKRLAEIEEEQKTEQQKLEDRAAAAEKAAADANEKLLRAEVAIAKGLPPALAARLVGADRAAMEADADALLALLPGKPATPPPAAAGVGVQGSPPAPVDLRTAPKAEVDAELRKLGVRRFS
jgi:hypothetical protein